MENNDKTFTKNQVKGLIAAVILVSFMTGGLSGLLFGIIGEGIAPNFITAPLKNILKISESSVGGGTVVNNIKVDENSATIDAVKKVSPSVVSVVATQDLSKAYQQTGPNAFPFNNFFDFNSPDSANPQSGQQEVSSGTGFIISSDGYIITNKHVVSVANAQYSVVSNDGKSYDANVVSTDPLNDIAVLKIDGKNLPAVELGDSDSVQIGQTVIAIGNTLGEYSNTVTRGVVSGINRTIFASGQNGSETLQGVIQTDAAINPGNSGGPLVNIAGQVVGIDTAIDRQGEAIGFAIPINEVKSSIESVKQTGKIVRPVLGIRYIIITPVIKEQNNLSVDYGALVVRGSGPQDLAVTPDGSADKAGIVENDIILEVNGQKIDENHILASIIRNFKPNDKVTLKILHDGKEKTVDATLGEYSS